MLHPSTQKLVERLSQMTACGKLDWTLGDDEQPVFDSEGYRVVLDADGSKLTILSDDGKELERAEGPDLAETLTEDGSTYSDLMSQMTREALRIARGTEQAISSILATLEDEDSAETAALVEAAAEATPIEEVEAEAIEADETLSDEGMEELAPDIIVEDPVDESDILSADDIAEMDADIDEAPIEEDPVAEESPVEESDDYVVSDDEADDQSVTDAVARLADEVNGPSEKELAASAIAATTLLDDADESEEAESEAVEAVEETDAAETADETVSEEEPEAEDDALVADLSNADETDEAVETAEQETEDMQSEPTEIVAEATEDTDSSADEPDITFAEEELSANISGDESVVTSVVSIAANDADEDNTPLAQNVVEEASEVEAIEAEEVISPTIADSDEDEAPSETQTDWSSVATGFGLGAVSVAVPETPETEIAEDIQTSPEPEAPAESEKVIIDATDEVTLEKALEQSETPDTDAFPHVAELAETSEPVATTPEHAAASQAETPEEETETVIQPKRFNPWS